MSLQPGKTVEQLSPTMVLQLKNIVINYTYRFSENKSEYIFGGQRLKNPKVPPLYINRQVGVNIYKDLNNSSLYKDFKDMPEIVSKEFLPEWKWTIEPDSNKVMLDYWVRRAHAVDQQGHSVAVWFAQELAIPDGPGEFSGLRGLILQVEHEDYVVKATSITIDKEQKSDIQMPEAEAYLTPEEFKERTKQK